MSGTRLERDSLGDVSVPSDRLWGAQTERARRHFDISIERMPRELVLALALVKRCAALVNLQLGALDARKAQAIAAAADEVIAGRHEAEFPLAVWQTGSGTQTNMNMNEVLANRASASWGAARSRPAGPSERRRELRAVVERRVPDGDERGGGPRRRGRTLAGARSAARHPGAEGARLHGRREDRAHASAGRHADDAGAGDCPAGRRNSTTASVTSRPRSRTCASWRLAARRSAPA